MDCTDTADDGSFLPAGWEPGRASDRGSVSASSQSPPPAGDVNGQFDAASQVRNEVSKPGVGGGSLPHHDGGLGGRGRLATEPVCLAPEVRRQNRRSESPVFQGSQDYKLRWQTCHLPLIQKSLGVGFSSAENGTGHGVRNLNKNFVHHRFDSGSEIGVQSSVG